MGIRDLEEEERKHEEFVKKHGYPPCLEDYVIYTLRHEEVSEEGMKELWDWYSREWDRQPC